MPTPEVLLEAWFPGVIAMAGALFIKFVVTTIRIVVFGSDDLVPDESPIGDFILKCLFWPIYLTFLLLKVVYGAWKFFRDLNTPIWRGWD